MDKVLFFAHKIIKEHINSDSICIDATMGNGNDTLFLAQISKKVYAFDIQEVAINKTKELCKDYDNITYILDSHENINKYVNENVQAIIFNLGYLPGGNKEITTKASVVLKAIDVSLSKLDKNGVIVITLYPGCESGLKESKALEEYLNNLNQKEFEVVKYQFINQKNNPPYLLIIERI